MQILMSVSMAFINVTSMLTAPTPLALMCVYVPMGLLEMGADVLVSIVGLVMSVVN